MKYLTVKAMWDRVLLNSDPELASSPVACKFCDSDVPRGGSNVFSCAVCLVACHPACLAQCADYVEIDVGAKRSDVPEEFFSESAACSLCRAVLNDML